MYWMLLVRYVEVSNNSINHTRRHHGDLDRKSMCFRFSRSSRIKTAATNTSISISRRPPPPAHQVSRMHDRDVAPSATMPIGNDRKVDKESPDYVIEIKCKKHACAYQFCLQKFNYEEKCRHYFLEYQKCFDRDQADTDQDHK
jgi:hypothetical protein